MVCFSLFWLALISKIVKFGQHSEIWSNWLKLSNLVEILKFVRFGMGWYGLNGSESTTINVCRGYVINVGRGYVITGVGIELLGQLKKK